MRKLTAFLLTLASPVFGQVGIAAKYPNDVGIGNDPAVIIADDFESYTDNNFVGHGWTSIAGAPVIDTAEHYAGNKSVRLTIPVSTAEQNCWLLKRPSGGADTVFIRAYLKFAPDYDARASNHNGLHVKGGTIDPGVPPSQDGTTGFTFLVQNVRTNVNTQASPGQDHVYAYWPKQRDNFGDHWLPDGNIIGAGKGDWLLYPAQYPDFKPMPLHQPELNKWYCYEMMAKLNTVGKSDGEIKWWCDGQVIGDFPNLFIRGVNTLKIDDSRVELHSAANPTALRKWYDNVVIATQYIGPMAPKPTPTPQPTGTQSPAPTGTPTASPTSTPSVAPSASPTLTPSPSATASGSPAAPSNLQATLNPEQPTSVVELIWNDNSDNEKEFRVARSPTGTGFVRIATLSPNSSNYTDAGLTPGATYYYQVNASNALGTSRQSNTAKVTTALTTPSPSPTTTPTATPTPTPTPAPSSTPSPSPTPTATPTATPSPPTPSPTPSLTPTPTASPTPTPYPSVTPSPTVTPTPGDTRTVTVEIMNPTPGDVYQVFVGDTAGVYNLTAPVLAGQSTVDIPNLKVGQMYYFCNRVLHNGLSSDFSIAVSYTVTPAGTQRIKIP